MVVQQILVLLVGVRIPVRLQYPDLALVVQWIRIRDYGSCDEGSNPSWGTNKKWIDGVSGVLAGLKIQRSLFNSRSIHKITKK